MCGIAGMMDLSGRRPAPSGVVRRMAAAIVHRGPDDDGFFDSREVVLGNRRLSIVGLADGKQPLANEDRTVNVVFNGELFDYPERRKDLEARGHVFRTHTDTELLPHLYEEHGEGMFVTLRGQFAVALWDEKEQRLLLARDRWGICPLFWTIQRPTDGEFAGGTWLLFASEIKALLASGLVTPRPDVRGLNHLFTFFATPGPVTCFEGVQQLVPGRYLDIRRGEPGALATGAEPSPQVFYEFDFPDRGQEIKDADPKTLTDEFEEVLTRSVNMKLRADVPVVSYLSGGVDSSIVVALAGKVIGRPIPTFTIGIGGDPSLNEETEATLVAKHVGSTDRVIVACGHNELLETYPELIRAAEVPVVDTACAALLLLAKSVREKGYKVALTGEGSDEWLAGYPWFKTHRLLGMLDAVPGLRLSRWVKQAALWALRQPRFPVKAIQRAEDCVGGPNAWFDIYGLMSLAKLRFFSREMLARLADHIPWADLGFDAERMRRWSPLNRSLAVGARVMLAGHLMSSKGDRVAMHSSVETRYPFLDEDVIGFLATVPPRYKLKGFSDKYLLRRVAERWLPKSIAWRKKTMFRAPLDSFHLDRVRELPGLAEHFRRIDRLLSPEMLAHTGYFDPAAVALWRGRIGRMRPGLTRTSVEMGLMAVTATQLWHDTFIERLVGPAVR
jgi:asparagine synthase (glutamine-hydrolysing)